MWPDCAEWKPVFQNFYSHIPCGMWRKPQNLLLLLPQFLLTHPLWDVTSRITWCGHFVKFLLTHPLWDVTETLRCGRFRCGNFYSHIPCGMWRRWHLKYAVPLYFYSHIPCGMWRTTKRMIGKASTFLLTHPLWDVTLQVSRTRLVSIISTHTSLVGCDMHLPN